MSNGGVAGILPSLARQIRFGANADRAIKTIAAYRNISEVEAEKLYGDVHLLHQRQPYSIDELWHAYAGLMVRGLAHEECIAEIDRRFRDRLRLNPL